MTSETFNPFRQATQKQAGVVYYYHNNSEQVIGIHYLEDSILNIDNILSESSASPLKPLPFLKIEQNEKGSKRYLSRCLLMRTILIA